MKLRGTCRGQAGAPKRRIRRPQTPGSAAPRLKRPALERMMTALFTLGRGGKVNARVLAGRFECSARTAQRDLEFIRDRMGVPLEYSQINRTWRLYNEMLLPPWMKDLRDYLFKKRRGRPVGSLSRPRRVMVRGF